MPAAPAAGWLARQLASRLVIGNAQVLRAARAIVLLGANVEAKSALAAHFAQARAGDDLVLLNMDCRHAGTREQMVAALSAARVDLPVVAADGTPADILAPRDGDRRAIIVAPALDAAAPWTLAQIHAACGVDGALPILVLDAALQPGSLEQQVRDHRAATDAAGVRLADACITSIDAAPRLGHVLDVAIRHHLALHAALGQTTGTPTTADALDAAALVARALAATGADARAEPLPRIAQLLRQGRALGEALASLRQRATGFEVAERAWSARRLAPALQEPAAADAQALTAGSPVAWRWCATRSGGAAQGLDAAGLPLPGAVVYAVADSMLPVLVAEAQRMAGALHLLPAPPDGPTWDWLGEHAQAWIASARGGMRVWHAGERRTLADCRGTARSIGDTVLHCQGRSVHVSLRRAPVALDVRGLRASALLDAWFADLRDRASGAPLPGRCGLLPRELPRASALRRVAMQLQTGILQPLTALAERRLLALGGTLAGAATRLAADALAALACRVDGEAGEWALQLRVELQNLAGLRHARGAKAVLESLIVLLATRDALRETGVAAWQVNA